MKNYLTFKNFKLLSLLLIPAAFFIINIIVLKDYGLNWDEPGNARYGDLLRHYYTSGFKDETVFKFANLYYYGGAFDLSASFISNLFNFDITLTRHTLGLLIATCGLYICSWIAHRAAGLNAAIASVFILSIWPLYIGHSHINSKDLPFAVGMLAICACLMASFSHWPKPKFIHFTCLGISLGCTFGLRVGAAISGIIFIFILLVKIYSLLETKKIALILKEAFQFCMSLLPALLFLIPITAFFWPWVAQDHSNIFEAISLFSKFSFDGKELFNEQLIAAREMPWYYIPLLLLYQLPEIIVVLLPISLLLFLTSKKHRSISNTIILSFFLIPLIWVLFSKPTLYNGIRHMLFIIPPLIIFTICTISNAIRHKKVQFKYAIIIAYAICASHLLYQNFQLHPYQYLAFNQFIGGIKGADHKFALDYWGISLKEAVEQLEHVQPNVKKGTETMQWTIWICGEDETIQNQLEDRFAIAPNAQSADYIIALNAFYCDEFKSLPKLFSIERQGVAFTHVYSKKQ